MAPADRKKLGLEASGEKHARLVRTLEREQQRILAGWLELREKDGVLTYNWNRMDRRSTSRKGLPDFQLWARGFGLLGEMKIGAAKLSPDQEETIARFHRSGTSVQIWRSAAEAIEAIRDWLGSL